MNLNYSDLNLADDLLPTLTTSLASSVLSSMDDDNHNNHNLDNDMSFHHANSCIVCMDQFLQEHPGIKCPNDHFICAEDLTSVCTSLAIHRLIIMLFVTNIRHAAIVFLFFLKFVAENVFPQVYKLRDHRCAVFCPADGCRSNFNVIELFSLLRPREKARYCSIVADLLGNDPNLRMLHSTLIDLMTLKCPSCKTPVDPLPDACSAVMCLNCGHYYCNYCFLGFSTGATDKDRAAAHEHAGMS